MRYYFKILFVIILFSTCKKDEEIYTTKNATVVVPPIVDTTYKLSCYPNPCTSIINVQIKLPKASSIIISIYNLNGRMVYQTTTTIQLAAGQSTIGIDISSLQSGLYFLRCETDSVVLIQKIIKN